MRGIVDVGRIVAELAVDLRERRRRRAVAARGRGRDARARSRRGRSAAAASGTLRASSIGANADTMSDTGAVTALSTSPSRHVVRIDSESLPTGIDTPSGMQNSSATARTVSYSAASSPGSPAAAIQFADSLTSARAADAGGGDVRDRFADRHATGRRAHRSARAACARPSPSPRRRSRRSRAASRRRRQPAPARTRPSDRARTARRPCDRRSSRGTSCRQRRATAARDTAASRTLTSCRSSRGSVRRTRVTSRDILGGLPRITSSGTSTGELRKCASSTTSVPFASRMSDDRKRAALAFADRGKALEIAGCDARARNAPAPRCTRFRAASCPVPRTGSRAASNRAADTAAVDQLGQRVRQAAGADIVNRQDRIGVAATASSGRSLPARAARISALPRCTESKSRSAAFDARRHRRRGAAAHADQHARAAELDQQRAGRERLLVPYARRAMLPTPPAIMIGL